LIRREPGIGSPRSLRASGDRWLFGYADVVTLLFACFAALYASQAAPAADVTPAAEVTPVPASLDATLVREVERLALEDPRLQIQLIPGSRATIISLAEAGSFAPGSADLTPAAEHAIRGLAALMKDRPVSARIEGHTDDRPIRTPRYESNWELSTARATRVVQFLVESGSFPPSRLSAAGYGEYRPLVPNDSIAARAKNRRVDIVVFDGAVQDELAAADYVSAGRRPSGGK
jgi:chemotaxis protein MotB